MHKNLLILLFTFFILGFSYGQNQEEIAHIRKGRLLGVSTLASTAYVGGITGLYYLWYKAYNQTGFHIINDNKAWLRADKTGHGFSAYQMGRVAYTGFRWAGLNEKKSVWIGGTYGFVFLSTVEILDGISTNWGFSWGDVLANAAGSALFIGQELLWKEQRIQVKFSYSTSKYAPYNPKLLGSHYIEKFLKDYNAQTYWLSINPQSFSGSKKIFPKWLNIAFGYGSKGMTGTYYNPKTVDGKMIPSFKRTAQFYLSLDLDMTKIKTHSEFLRLVLEVANMVKIPFPTLEFNSEDGLEFHAIYF